MHSVEEMEVVPAIIVTLQQFYMTRVSAKKVTGVITLVVVRSRTWLGAVTHIPQRSLDVVVVIRRFAKVSVHTIIAIRLRPPMTRPRAEGATAMAETMRMEFMTMTVAAVRTHMEMQDSVQMVIPECNWERATLSGAMRTAGVQAFIASRHQPPMTRHSVVTATWGTTKVVARGRTTRYHRAIVGMGITSYN